MEGLINKGGSGERKDHSIMLYELSVDYFYLYIYHIYETF